MPAGHTNLWAAKGGDGKGLRCAALTAAITTDGFWPDGYERAKPGSIYNIVFTNEKAQSLGVKTIDEAEFLRLVGA